MILVFCQRASPTCPPYMVAKASKRMSGFKGASSARRRLPSWQFTLPSSLGGGKGTIPVRMEEASSLSTRHSPEQPAALYIAHQGVSQE